MLQVLQCLSGLGLTSSGGSGQVGSEGGNSSGASRKAVKERFAHMPWLFQLTLLSWWPIIPYWNIVFPHDAIRFRSFNMQFEEIYQKQCGWSVPDSELRESLRLAVAEILLPAYRSFQKRFGYFSWHTLTPHAHKQWISMHQPEPEDRNTQLSCSMHFVLNLVALS